MALNSKEKERIDKLDFAKGGGFSDFITDRKKLKPVDSRFLFVGLGGKGSSTVASLKTAVYQKLLCNEKAKRPENFEYLVLDTDKGNLEKLEQGSFGEVGLSASPEDAETCQLYDSTAAERLSPAKRSQIPASITQWLHPSMNQELQGDGAGGIRQAGRYLLFGDAAFQTVKNALTLKLRKLHAQITNAAAQKLIIYIFAGVGGGTGSGTVIDIPYIIREICRQNGWDVRLYAYIFLPDTYADDARELTYVKYNSYAALKEIDTLMNIGQMDGTAYFQAKYAPGFSVNSTERIFDSCVLVSGKKMNGGMVSHPDRYSRKVVVDNIINLVSRNVMSDGSFLVNSYLDNKPSLVQTKVDELLDSQIPKNAYYQYTVIGTGALVLPVEQILAYMAHHTFCKLETAWDQHADQKDADAFLASALKPEEIAGKIMEKAKASVMKYQRKGASVNKNQVIDDSYFHMLKSSWLNRNVELYNAWDQAKAEYLEFLTNQINEKYSSLFKERGIRFLMELLSFKVIEGKSFNGVCQKIQEEYIKSLEELISGEQVSQEQIAVKMAEIQGNLSGTRFFASSGRLIEEYRELCIARLVSENKIRLYDETVRNCYRQLSGFFETKMRELQSYLDVFAYLEDVIERNYRCVMDGTMPQAEYAGRLIDFNRTEDEDTQKVISYLDSMLSEKTPQGLAAVLAGDMEETKEKWMLRSDDFNPMGVFVDFLERQYGEIPNLTIEKFIQIKYGDSGLGTGMNSICQELQNKAEVIFPADTIISLSSLASQRYVVVPAGAPSIVQNMDAFAKKAGASVAQSDDMNSIFWYNMVIGVPLFLLKDIQEYEQLYENNHISGMHCLENGRSNWKEWPALSNQSLWNTADFNLREKQYAAQVQQAVEAYLACGLIESNALGEGEYCAYCMPQGNSSITEETVLAWCRDVYMKDPVTDDTGAADTGVGMVRAMAAANGWNIYQVKIPTVYIKITKENLYQIVRMNVFLYHRLQDTYEIYMACRAVVEQENAGRQGERRQIQSMQRFYDYVRTGIIQITEDAVFLEQRDGEQEEILYFDDYTEQENKYYIYYAVLRFSEIFDEEQLEELDEYWEELSRDRSEEARTKYRQLSDALIQECIEVRDSLKKVSTKRELKEAGHEELIDIYSRFFQRLIGMKKGK